MSLDRPTPIRPEDPFGIRRSIDQIDPDVSAPAEIRRRGDGRRRRKQFATAVVAVVLALVVGISTLGMAPAQRLLPPDLADRPSTRPSSHQTPQVTPAEVPISGTNLPRPVTFHLRQRGDLERADPSADPQQPICLARARAAGVSSPSASAIRSLNAGFVGRTMRKTRVEVQVTQYSSDAQARSAVLAWRQLFAGCAAFAGDRTSGVGTIVNDGPVATGVAEVSAHNVTVLEKNQGDDSALADTLFLRSGSRVMMVSVFLSQVPIDACGRDGRGRGPDCQLPAKAQQLAMILQR